MSRFYSILTLIFSIVLASSCGNAARDENTIRVGIVAGPEREIAETVKKVAKDSFNLEVELVTFNDYVMPNEALNSGDIDANAFQHVPYLETQSGQRGYKLAVVGNTFVYPIIAYSTKISSLADLKDGSTIAIPNDPTNGGRALLLLEKNGLITLKENVGILPKVIDISSNAKKLRILELEAPQLPKVLDDKEVTIAIINNNFAAQAGLDPNEIGLFSEDSNSPYVNVIVSREDNKNENKVKKFVQAYQSKIVEEVAQELFKGQAIKGW